MKDVVIIGGGLAGLSAAWRLKHQDLMVLESNSRVGGRICSERRGNYWLNWGGHVFGGENTATDELLKSVGVESRHVPGTLSAMAMNGKLLTKGRVETFPFRVPMSWKSRFSMLLAGAKVRAAVLKYGKVAKKRNGEDYKVQQQRVMNYMNDQTFADYVGKLPEDADAIFRPTVSRSTGDPEQISAGAGIGYFHMIWNKKEGLSKNIVGGPSTLTDTIAETLGDRVQVETVVDEVIHKEDHVTVKYTQGARQFEVNARYVILATPAPITRKIATNIDPFVGEALDQVVYGPHVSAAFLTDEKGKQVWDDVYALATPKRSFDILINSSNLIRSFESERQPGSSFMTFSPAQRGRDLIDKTEEEIKNIYLKDLDEIFPGFSKYVVEAKVTKWPLGSAYVYPGRADIQPTLTQPAGRLFLAGDYLGTLYTETAVRTGFDAAQNINSLLGTEKYQESKNNCKRYQESV